jgi:GAF domain-containing protein
MLYTTTVVLCIEIEWQVLNFFPWFWEIVHQQKSTACLVRFFWFVPMVIIIGLAGVLVTFYCGKLDDTETLIPALKGLATLASLSTCASSEAEDIIRAYGFSIASKLVSNRPL